MNYAKLPDCQSRRSSHQSQRGGRWLRKAKINTDIRVTPSVKAKAMRRALQEGMSLANYIAWLIERDNRGANQKPKRP